MVSGFGSARDIDAGLAVDSFQLGSTTFANTGNELLSVFVAPTPGPVATPDLLDEFPPILITGGHNRMLICEVYKVEEGE